MSRSKKQREEKASSEEDVEDSDHEHQECEEEDNDELESIDVQAEVNPYEILSVDKTASSDQIKSAYREAALRHHPDKATGDRKEEAHKRFQEVALAYAVLSDEKRRRRYDSTGSTKDTLEEDDDFDWADFFRSQSEQLINTDTLEKFKKEYQGSEEERQDVLSQYTESKGKMDAIFESIMCSEILADEERFRAIIDGAIAQGQVESYKAYTTESKASKERRKTKAKAEEREAMDLAEELGVKDKLFGNGSSNGANGAKKKTKSGKGQDTDMDGLKALIQQRQKGRAENFLDNLEAKYGGGSKRKTLSDEPSEEMFAKNRKKGKKG